MQTRNQPVLDSSFKQTIISNKRAGWNKRGLINRKCIFIVGRSKLTKVGNTMALPVVEFSRQGYKIGKVFP